MEFEYAYSISAMPTQSVDLAGLKYEVEQFGMGSGLIRLSIDGDNLSFFYDHELTTQEQSNIGQVVFAHNGDLISLEPIVLELVIGGNIYHVVASRVNRPTQVADETHELVEA